MAEETKTIESKNEETSSEVYSPSEEEQKLIEKWKKRFKRADEFLTPYRAKWLRMYKLYRAYQDKQNYAYETRLMPPIAFEIIETIVSRLATSKRKTRILPREKKDLKSKSLGSWDDLVNYDFDAIKLDKKLPKWLKSTTKFGNGIGKVTWLTDSGIDYDDPFLTICDLWDIMPAPETEDLQEDCPWLIHRIVKTKDKIEREEKARGEGNAIYKNLQFVEPKLVDDWKQDRYDVNLKKMGQIQDSADTGGDVTVKVTSDKTERDRQIEIWECWDYEEGKLVTIMNQEVVVRNDDNPYKKVNAGKIFINLPDHELDWELWAIGHIEPVETTIVEIADMRNQRMDDVILMLDPVIKIRKDSGISKNDVIFAPGAKWELRKMDDVVIERPPEISLMGINEEKNLRDEIERTLAISEYVSGMPKSAQEPMSKVAMLIGQSNLRMSSLAGNLAEALTTLANILIDMNREFISEDKLYRIVGDEVDFKEFKKDDKEVKVDAVVQIEPVIPPDQATRLNQAMTLYDKFVAADKPDPNNPEEVKQWKKRKRAIQEMILDEMDKAAYKTVLLGEEESEPAKSTEEEPPAAPESPQLPAGEAGPAPEAQPEQKASFFKQILSKIPVIGKGRQNKSV
ncbi:MAG: hypothetical protein WC410_00155 [Candidatus Paceibacterota bacterium]|jgi:hypothetical protein